MNILFPTSIKGIEISLIKKLSLKESMNSYLLSYKKLKSISLLERPLFKFDKNLVINFYQKMNPKGSRKKKYSHSVVLISNSLHKTIK